MTKPINPNSRYGQAKALAEKLGLPHKTVYSRILRGWSEERIRDTLNAKTYDPEKIKQVADKIGVKPNAVYTRLRKGEALEEIEKVGRKKTLISKKPPKKPTGFKVDVVEVAKNLPLKARLFCGVAA